MNLSASVTLHVSLAMAEAESTGFKLFEPFKYQCSFPDCDLEFRRRDRLEAHEYTHSKQRKFKCNEPNCGRAYITNCHLRRHQRTAHAEPTGPILCTHESCAEYFTSLEQMKEHCRAIHSEKRQRQFECEVCAEKFHRKTHLKQHLFAKHAGHYRFSCDKCGKGYLLESRLKRHQASHKTHTCEVCSMAFEKWSLFVAHKQKEHANVEMKCDVCDKIFNSRRCLKEHRKIHVNINERNEIPCTFEGCQKFFLRRNNMLAHFKLKHENRKFVCTYDDCNLELSTKQKLDQHVRVIHLGEMGQKKGKPKSKSEIAKRKDTGVQKRSTASKLFQVILPPEFEQAIIAGHGRDIEIKYDRVDDDNDEDEMMEKNENEEAKDDIEKDGESNESNGQSDNNQFVGLAVVNPTVELRNSGAVKC